jgi:hypothetical protein
MPDVTQAPAADTEQPRGNFIAGFNRGKAAGSREPDFTGRLSIPGRSDEHRMALWTHRDKRGRAYFAGTMNGMPLSKQAAAQIEFLADQAGHSTGEVILAAPNLELEPYQIVIFPNGFKEPNTADTPAEAEKRAKRPDYWGRVNPGDGSPAVAISMWLTQDRYQNPLLTGATSYPIPGRKDGMEEQRPAEAPSFEEASGGRRGRRNREGRE